jgi:hypothetical protein
MTDIGSIIEKISTFFHDIVAQLQNYLPLEKFSVWLQEKVPFFSALDKPLLIFAIGLLIIWIMVAFATDMLKRYSWVFALGILFIAVAGYLGYVSW